MSGWNRTRTDRYNGKTPARRGRRLSFERCEDRRLLSTASSLDTDWMTPILPALATLLPSSVWQNLDATALAARNRFTFSNREGPERSALDPGFAQAFGEAVQQADTELDFAWGLESREVEETGVLPPTPWFDDEFRETLRELLLPEGNRGGAQWSIQFQTSLLGSDASSVSCTSRWESASLLDFGLNFENTAHFQAWLVCVVFPQETSASASVASGLVDRPMLVQAIGVDMFWSDVNDFWSYPVAEDMMTWVTGFDTFRWWDGRFAEGGLPREQMENRALTRALQFGNGVFTSELGGSIETSVAGRHTSRSSDCIIASPWTSQASAEDHCESVMRLGASWHGTASWQERNWTLAEAEEIVEFEPLGFRFRADGRDVSDRLDSPWSGTEATWRLSSSIASISVEPESRAMPPAADSASGTLLAAEASRIGFRRLLPGDVLCEASSVDVVDVALLAQERFCVTAPDTAFLADKPPLPSDAFVADEVGGFPGTRGRCQAFDLVHAEEDFSDPVWDARLPDLEPAGDARPTTPNGRLVPAMPTSVESVGGPLASSAETAATERRSASPAYAAVCRSGWTIACLAVCAAVDAVRRSLRSGEEERGMPQEHRWPRGPIA